MDAYVEEDAVYFSTKEKVAFAKYSPLIKNRIESGSLKIQEGSQGSKQKFTKSLKRYHAAEHKVYNCFSKKIKHCHKTISCQELLKFLPNIKEAQSSESFSLFCSTTQAYFLIISMSLLISLNLLMHSFLSICISLCFGLSSIYFIQKNFFLEEPGERELILAIRALEELLKGE